jgi:hypothetical protein
MAVEADRHHVKFPRAVHEANLDTREIRRNRWLIPTLVRVGHTALHNEVTIVPPLDLYTARIVNRDFEPAVGSHIGSMYSLMSAIEGAIKHPRATAIQIENAQLAIHALELQIPFIKEYQV